MACTCSVVAAAGVAQWLCGASNVVNIATAGPCGVAARGAQAADAMAPHKHVLSLFWCRGVVVGAVAIAVVVYRFAMDR